MNQHAIKLRIATHADINALVDFNAAMALETEAKQLDRDVLRAGVAGVLDQPRRGFYLLAEMADGIAGGLLITYEWSDWRCGDWWWIQSVFVRPEFRRHGVFRALHAEVEQRARAADAVGIRLYVEWENQRAQQTYEVLGMQREHYHMYAKAFRNIL
ncbi:GNAT family N-acetyltransferase [Pseudolysobacter antarcticus]|uniref:GNAT family N-acetyltransferase n=1 Tax=Pseudolysobacter antarcticus TaxID=2511995 RepID=A0A411HF58_9GAMM|nr:GNAT family N-acetyltransferase [Pseudolysobacter antarcticus]QBB69120.1 GNAT family N-acetyltransferase [Pseudolysobacter antarcticus]